MADKSVELSSKGAPLTYVAILDEVALDADDAVFTLGLTRDAWPAGHVADVVVERWDEELQDWVFHCGCRLDGGEHVDRFGNTVPVSTVSASFPEHGKAGRRTRVIVNPVKAFSAAISLDVRAAELSPSRSRP